MTSPTVIAKFDIVAAAKPRKVAIYWGRDTVTYGQLRDRIDRYAANLRANYSIRPRDRVGILLKNSPEFIYALYAALKCGATVVPINSFLKAPEIQYIADDCQLSCLVTTEDFDATTSKLRGVTVVSIDALDRPLTLTLSRTPHEGTRPTRTDSSLGAVVGPLPPAGAGTTIGPGALPSCAPQAGRGDGTGLPPLPKNHSGERIEVRGSEHGGQGDRGREAAPTWPVVTASDIAVIIYTSGTTGKPKGALLSHGNITSNVHSCIQALEETLDDRLTLLLPMFHSFMLTVCIFTPLSMGAGIVLIRSIHPLKAAMREIIMNRATIFVGIPQIFQALAQAKIPFWLRWVLKLRVAVSGAAPLPRETLAAFERKLKFPLLEGYGLSEASPVVSFNPVRGVRKGGSVGLPLPGIEVKIFDDDGRELPVDQVGEVVVRGPNVMQGYYNQPAETAATLRHGWLHTGDMGKKDADGYLYIVDRRKEMFLVRGMNVYPREIEEVLYQFPNVREAAVVARPDEKRGEAALAFVCPVEGATLQPDEILRFCRERLADYKLPKEIRIVSALPHTATGKIAKLELKKMV